MDECEMIGLMKRDPERGLDAAINAYGALVLSVARTALLGCGSEKDAEECAADAFMGLFLRLDGFDPAKGTVKAYLCSAARNRAVDIRRRKAREAGGIPLDDGNGLPGGDSPEDRVEQAETRRELIDAVNALGEPDREIIVRRYYLGESSRAVAKRVGLSVSAVNTRASRALKRLNAFLTDKRSAE